MAILDSAGIDALWRKIKAKFVQRTEIASATANGVMTSGGWQLGAAVTLGTNGQVPPMYGIVQLGLSVTQVVMPASLVTYDISVAGENRAVVTRKIVNTSQNTVMVMNQSGVGLEVDGGNTVNPGAGFQLPRWKTYEYVVVNDAVASGARRIWGWTHF